MSERIELGGGWCFETGEDGVARLFNPEGFYADRWWHPEDARAFATAIRPQVNVEANGTPGARWREEGKPDPHGTHYDCERSRLAMGDLTDDELADAAFLNYDRRPNFNEVIAGRAKMPIVYMTAVKDRIRWLSRQLAKVSATPAPPPQTSGSVPDEIARAIKAYGDACDKFGATDASYSAAQAVSTTRAHLDALILDAICKPSAAVIPEGWRMVPIEPTDEMVREAYKAQIAAINVGFSQAYRTMCAASPTPPAITLADICKPSAAVIPPGWKLVPLEPTAKMLQVIEDASDGEPYEMVYRSMIEDAPTPPAITLADIAALILNLERNSTVQYERECPHGTVDASLAIDITLRVAAEAVLAMGNPSPETKP